MATDIRAQDRSWRRHPFAATFFRSSRDLPDRLASIHQRCCGPRGSDQMASPTMMNSAPAAANLCFIRVAHSRHRAVRTPRPTIPAARRSPRSRAGARRHPARRTAGNRRRLRQQLIESWRVMQPADADNPVRLQVPAPPASPRCRSHVRHRRPRARRCRHGHRAAAPRRHPGPPAPVPSSRIMLRSSAVLSRTSTAAMSAAASSAGRLAPASRVVHDRRRQIEPRRGREEGVLFEAILVRARASLLLFQILLPLALAGEAVHRARWAKACWPAATFSALPDQAFCGAACNARP